MSDQLDNIIEEEVQDSVTPAEPDVVDSADTDVVADSSVEEDAVSGDNTEDADNAVTPPANATDKVEDDFAKRFGLQSQSITGRENRIPYSRVKKIVEKAQRDAREAAAKELEGKFNPQLTETQTKIQDYEQRLERVAQFEHVLENDPRTFLQILSQIPAYGEFFQRVSELAKMAQGQQGQGQNPVANQNVQNNNPNDPMPQPDQEFPDGTKGYSMEGLAKLFDWRDRQVESRVLQQAEERISKRYAPIEQQWQAQQEYQRAVPVVEKQIAEARTWPNFNELENEVVKLLQADQRMTLEGAYMRAYQTHIVPRMTADRQRVKSEVLEELKKRPAASAAPSNPTKPTASANKGPRSLEEIIAAEVEKLKQ